MLTGTAFLSWDVLLYLFCLIVSRGQAHLLHLLRSMVGHDDLILTRSKVISFPLPSGFVITPKGSTGPQYGPLSWTFLVLFRSQKLRG
uniref:Uncharacterized protein n=1 Tax=Anguilla anguilla TaxID=7936 RepID=A0A0E9VMW1_ANGAN